MINFHPSTLCSIKSDIRSPSVLYLIDLPLLVLLVAHHDLQLLALRPGLQQVRGFVVQRLPVFAHVLRDGYPLRLVDRPPLLSTVEVDGLGQRRPVDHHGPGLQPLGDLPSLDALASLAALELVLPFALFQIQ